MTATLGKLSLSCSVLTNHTVFMDWNAAFIRESATLEQRCLLLSQEGWWREITEDMRIVTTTTVMLQAAFDWLDKHHRGVMLKAHFQKSSIAALVRELAGSELSTRSLFRLFTLVVLPWEWQQGTGVSISAKPKTLLLIKRKWHRNSNKKPH